MMKMQSVKFEGESRINEVIVCGFSGSFSFEQNMQNSFSQIIFDEQKYNENKATCDSDFEQFKNKAKTYWQKVNS